MRTIAPPLFLLPVAIPIAIWACSSSDGSPVASADAGADVSAPDSGDELELPPPIDASQRACSLENGGDPVALCVQKLVLQGVHDSAFHGDAGTVSSWDSTSFQPDTDDAGAPLHTYADDVAYGSAIGNYLIAAEIYGDTEATDELQQTLVTVAGTLEAELAAPPADYDGTTYARLRLIAGQLRTINENTHADKIDALAESYAKAIVTTYTKPVAPGGDGGSGGGTVLGTDGGNGQVAYRPAAVATGALALVDMAVRHGGDDPTNAALYAKSAMQAVDYLYTRAREPSTQLYYASLVTSADPGHDALAPGGTPDALLSDVQATVMLALVRTSTIVKANASNKAIVPLVSYPFLAHAEELLREMNGVGSSTGDGGAPVSLWDSTGTGYFEGYVPSTQTLLTNKPTIANGLAFAAIHHAFVDDPPTDGGAQSLEVTQLKALRALLIARLPANSSLLSVINQGAGQIAYLRASSSDFHLATTPDGGVEPRAASYRMLSTAAALEGLSEQGYGTILK